MKEPTWSSTWSILEVFIMRLCHITEKIEKERSYFCDKRESISYEKRNPVCWFCWFVKAQQWLHTSSMWRKTPKFLWLTKPQLNVYSGGTRLKDYTHEALNSTNDFNMLLADTDFQQTSLIIQKFLLENASVCSLSLPNFHRQLNIGAKYSKPPTRFGQFCFLQKVVKKWKSF